MRKRSTPGDSTALRGLQSDGPLVTSFALGNRATLLCPRLPAASPPTHSKFDFEFCGLCSHGGP